ncbi:MAG: nucleoside triphosphate pyrophosphohydrolase, partial [Candidatus Doudnabacteria bacterium]|nr:nucleoside triphosphate pyrophosphohydrolase [Candidatus Doudnabacteria bacterium]
GDKLIRDKIPEILDRKGVQYRVRVAGPEEFVQLKREKLREEVQEYLSDSSIFELADILEVIFALAKEKYYTPEMLEMARKQRPHLVRADESKENSNRRLQAAAERVIQENTIINFALVLEILCHLAKEHGYTPAKFEFIRRQKHHDRGGFDKRLVLMETID